MSVSVTAADPSVQPAPQSGRQSPREKPTLVLGPNVTFTGIMQVDGPLQIECRIEADVRCETLVIGFYGRIRGVVVANRVEIYGSAAGEIYANTITIKGSGHVEAELNYKSIVIEPGAYFEGRSRRHKNPIGLSPNFNPQ
ncbi:MAG: bactofilin family protein [Methyloligellaceae bacterium]